MTLLENPTPLELGLEKADDSFGRLAPQVQRITAIGRTDTPADWLPYVLEDKGLEAIVPYVRDMPKALREGPYWLKKRGTDVAIAIGIGWVDGDAAVAPPDGRHHWYHFQVAYPAPPVDRQVVRQMVGIANLSKSSWDQLFRVYSPDYDHRPVRMDMQRADDGGWTDDYSGKPRWPGGPYISFGRNEAAIADFGITASSAALIETTRVLDWFDGMRLDVDRFESAPILLWQCATEIEETRTSFVFEDTWGDAWPDGPWGEGDITGFVAVTRVDGGTLVVSTEDEDTWPDEREDRPWGETRGYQLFTSVEPSETAVFAFTDDTWPRVYPTGSWNDALGGQPIPMDMEKL